MLSRGVQILDRSGQAAFQTLLSSGIDQRNAGTGLRVFRRQEHKTDHTPGRLHMGKNVCTLSSIYLNQLSTSASPTCLQPYLSAVLCLQRSICTKRCCEIGCSQ
ncbi:hypothetical protein ACOMHN_042390 [Nucella lapillus]